MKIDIHIRIDTTADSQLFLTSGQKINGNNLATVDQNIIEVIAKLQETLENQLVQEAQHSGYQVTHRTAPLFPVPDHL